MTKIRAAVVQAAPVGFDPSATLDRVQRLVRTAAEQGAEFVVLPEAFLSAYPKGLDFGTRVGSRSGEGREMFRRYFDSAITIPGPETTRLGEIVSAAGVDMVIGVVERDLGTLYCTALFCGRDGSILGKHRKLIPTALERVIWGSGDGSTLTVVDTGAARVGAAICWENYMPLYRAVLYQKGVQLYCAPTVDDRESWIPTIRHIAFEGRCFVLSACQFARRSDYPEDYPADTPAVGSGDTAAVLIRGGSAIVDPTGRFLAGPVYDQEAVHVAELDLDEITRGKFDLDVAGHYARPDVFKLMVEEGRG
jgi:nitrilase